MKHFIKSTLFLLAAVAVLGSCNPQEEVIIQAESLQIVTANPIVFVDSVIQLDLVITPSNANAQILWSSNTPAVATVDSVGCVKGISKGSAIINAISGTSVASVVVNVYNNPCTVQLSMYEIKQTTATVEVSTSDEEGYYYCGYAKRGDIKNVTDDNIIAGTLKTLQSTMQTYAQYGMAITLPELLQQGSKRLSASGLEASTEYTMFAFGLDPESLLASAVTRLDFKTIDVVPSSNVFAFEIDSIVGAKVFFSVTPSNNDPYACQVASTSSIEKQGGYKGFMEYARTYFNTYYASYGGWDAVLTKGKLSSSLSSAKDSTEYSIIAVGYDGGWTTEFQTYTFTYYKPAEPEPEAAPARSKDDEINLYFVEFDPSFVYIKNRCY